MFAYYLSKDPIIFLWFFKLTHIMLTEYLCCWTSSFYSTIVQLFCPSYCAFWDKNHVENITDELQSFASESELNGGYIKSNIVCLQRTQFWTFLYMIIVIIHQNMYFSLDFLVWLEIKVYFLQAVSRTIQKGH